MLNTLHVLEQPHPPSQKKKFGLVLFCFVCLTLSGHCCTKKKKRLHRKEKERLFTNGERRGLELINYMHVRTIFIILSVVLATDNSIALLSIKKVKRHTHNSIKDENKAMELPIWLIPICLASFCLHQWPITLIWSNIIRGTRPDGYACQFLYHSHKLLYIIYASGAIDRSATYPLSQCTYCREKFQKL